MHDAPTPSDTVGALLGGLTPREKEILLYLTEGVDAKRIAHRDRVSVDTVRTQIAAILSKLKVRSQLAAVAYAHRAGWKPEAATYRKVITSHDDTSGGDGVASSVTPVAKRT